MILYCGRVTVNCFGKRVHVTSTPGQSSLSCLVPRPHENALTEKAWKNALQGLARHDPI